MPTPTAPIKDLIDAVEDDLQSLEPEPFSEQAFETLKGEISTYITEIIGESVSVAKRNQADTVSAAHVRKAAEYLTSSSSRKFFRHLGTIGGIILGAAVGNLLAITSSNQLTTSSVVVTAILGIVGSFMVALHIAKD